MGAFDLLREAINKKIPIEVKHGGRTRIGCPHKLGYDKNSKAKVLLYQTGGDSSSGLAGSGSGGNWRWVFVTEMSSVVLSPGPWTTPAHQPSCKRPTCTSNDTTSHQPPVCARPNDP